VAARSSGSPGTNPTTGTTCEAGYLYPTGVVLAVGIIAYDRALSLGPVSIVVPIFGLFLVTFSLVGVVALDESLTTRKAAGIGFAMLAVYLTSVE
jgi:transporter family protein